MILGPDLLASKAIGIRYFRQAIVNSEKRLEWYGIEPLKEEVKGVYTKDCDCEFYPELDLRCNCGWNKKITISEHEQFQNLRIVNSSSKSGII